MVAGELILFLCLFTAFVVLLRQRLKFTRVHIGPKLVIVGLGLVSLTSFIDFLVVGPNHVLPTGIHDEEFIEFWRIYGYVPGMIFILLGMAGFIPAMGALNKAYDVREASERKLLQQAVDLNEAKMRAEKAELILREALESIADAFVIFDAEDKLIAYNSQYKKLFPDVADILEPGVTFEELIRYQAMTSDLLESDEEKENWVQQRLEEHRNPDEAKEQIFKDGQIYRLSEFKTASGGTVAVRTNITDLRNRERALIHLNERLEEAQSVAHLGSWSKELSSNKLEWSDEVSRIMGYELGTIPHEYSYYTDRIHPDDIDEMFDIVRSALKEQDGYQVEYRMVHPDGKVVHVRELGKVVKNSAGEPVALHGTMQDITAEQEVEQELLEAKKKAEEGTKAKSMFLANMSHELRTPLNAIIGFAEVISKEIFGSINNEKYKEYSENILSSGQHLLSLINDILDYSRLEAGKFELDEVEAEMREILSWTELLLRPRAQEKHIALNVDLDTDLIFSGDERKIKQVLINLVNNAVKFTPPNGVVDVFVEDSDFDHVRIVVQDNGYGISDEDLKQIMRPFVRTVNSMTRSIEGTGLGLPLSKSIVELHGGKLEMQSKQGIGTRVDVLMPRRRFEKMQTLKKKA
ncbi:PAS domain-containing protein [Sneathiella sp. P13V-1]|uniref:ATP-binding protein n=1 Tax=Sneathiella sp. P13V-1 TaxID=2697366 RepID=UPI00187B22F8|nr:ATP-binding protein [Sneathiella sp. P13V-1]MBE7636646.1 PAS domain-containing protein [Sneathiella sp. P13V-1]